MSLHAVAVAMLLLSGGLEQDYKAMTNESRVALVTIIATYPDGTPMKGHISCGGFWYKHQDGDPDISGPEVPFETDSRGAVHFNPHLEDEGVYCTATDGVHTGDISVLFNEARPRGVYRVVVPR